MLVVVDIDDVLINLNESVQELLNKWGYEDFSVDNIYTYDLNKSIDISKLPVEKQKLSDNGLGCPRERILNCYSDSTAFIYASCTENMVKGMKLLSKHFDVVLNSTCSSPLTASTKADFYREYFGTIYNVTLNLSVRRIKPVFDDCYAVFDDCVEELVRYPSETKKFIVNRPQNRDLFYKTLISQQSNIKRCENFYDGVKKLVEEVKHK